MAAEYDLIVVGAGPAGTTLAGITRKLDPKARVLILDKAVFPRHRIGESLLPGMIPVLKELGAYEELNRAGFPRKIGVVFVWGKDRKPWDADFNNLNLEMIRKHGRALDTEFSWQVLRSRYDQILLDNARSLGAEVRLGWRAVEPTRAGGKVTGLVVEGPGGQREVLRAARTADCTGQAGFIPELRASRRYRPDLRNAAGYAYFRGAKWKFKYAGHPDKTKIFVCSVPEGWFWYIPLADDLVSVGLVSKADYIRRKAGGDFRGFFEGALRRCGEIWPLLKGAERVRGLDPAEPGKEFFTVSDWSFTGGQVCGPGWAAAGDSAFFIDPLLSSGVLMAHLSGHRAAYTFATARREKDPALRRLLWEDYSRFCGEVGNSFLALVRYWYGHDPNAARWWKEARKGWSGGAPLDLSDKMSFVAVASGLNYHFERDYTTQSLLFGSSGAEHTWQWEGTKLELKRWTRQILAIVETGFLKGPARGARAKAAERNAKLRDIPDDRVPSWALPRRLETAFLPDSKRGRLSPASRLVILRNPARGEASAANPRRILPRSYLEILRMVDGRRSIGEIRNLAGRRLKLPQEVLDGQVFRLFKDLAVLGAIKLKKGKRNRTETRKNGPWEQLRAGERLLKDGNCPLAHENLSAAISGGAGTAWAFALRGEARRHLGRLPEALADLDEAVRRNTPAATVAAGRRLQALSEEFEAGLEAGWLRDRILIFRAKARLAGGDPAGARADAEQALLANPRHSEALILRAKAALELGDHARAKEDLKAALTIEKAGARGEG